MNNKQQDDNNLCNSISECFSFSIGRLIMKVKQLEKHPRKYGEAGFLTQSEIHIINSIGCEDGILMSELASRMGVTKGAITHIVSRMEVKEFVRRSQHPNDSRATIVSLTKKGVLAYQAHHEMHKAFYRQLCDQLSPQEIEIFRICIDKYCDVFEE